MKILITFLIGISFTNLALAGLSGPPDSSTEQVPAAVEGEKPAPPPDEQKESEPPVDPNYMAMNHFVGISVKGMDSSLGFVAKSGQDELIPQLSLRLFSAWTLTYSSGGGGDGRSSARQTNRTDPDVPHDYDYEIFRHRKWDLSVVRDFHLGHSERFTWFAGGGLMNEDISARFHFYNMDGWTTNDAGWSIDRDNITALMGVAGFRYTELKTGIPLVISGMLEIPLTENDSYEVTTPEGKKLSRSYWGDDGYPIDLAVSIGFMF